ncbi:MAG: radical SAM/SPASM domain-containing protein [Paludibacteraceae bacterium]
MLHYYIQILKTFLVCGRLWNALKLQVSYWLSVFGIVTKWKVKPQFISIEPTNVCNLKCPECPVGIRTKRVKTVNIDLDSAKKILDELSSGLMHVILYFQGEPLLGRNFIDLVRYAKSKNLLTSTSTNAQLIGSSMAKSIVESGLDKLIVSVDGTTQETYETYRIGGRLDKAVAAIEYLVKWKKELKLRSPAIEIQFLVLKTNEHQMGEMRQLAKKLKADKLTFKSAQLYDYENVNPLLTTIGKYARYELHPDGKYHIKLPLKNRCKRTWTGAVINSKGDVLPCCFDKDSTFSFGNIKDSSFAENWHSDKAFRFRKRILANRKQFEMCRNCSER